MNRSDLFDTPPQPAANCLPYDGIVNDYGIVFEPAEADAHLAALLAEIPWRHDEAVICGRRIATARRVAWYGDSAFAYTYSGITRTALSWTERLLAVRQAIEKHVAGLSPAVFNSCLLNLYSDGLAGMGWHSDDEEELGANPVIASVSLGAARKFSFKHKQTREKREMLLQHGQLIVMRGQTQQHWLHAVMKSMKVCEPRISLTFRTFVGKRKRGG